MIHRILITFSLIFLSLSFSLQAQPPSKSQIMIFPFDQEMNSENHPWVSEALADLLSQASEQAGYRTISRSDRLDAYNMLGLSPWRRPTLAMQLKMAEYLQATHMLYGRYQINGKALSGEVHLLDLQQLRLLKRYSLSATLSNLPRMKEVLCQKLQAEKLGGQASSCKSSASLKKSIPGRTYELFIKSLMEDSSEQKEEYINQALQISPRFHRAILSLGQLHFDNLNLNQAEEILKKIENERSQYGAEACMMLGEIYLEKKNYELAVAVLKKAISYGGTGKSHLLLAKAFFHLGELAKATMETELSLKLDPSDIDAREFRKMLLKNKKID